MTARFTARDRRALRSVAVQFFVNGALYASYAPRLPEIRDRVGMSVAGIGAALALAGAAGLAGSALVSPAIARWGTRRVMIVSSVAVSTSLVVVGTATTPVMLVAGLIGMMTFDVLVDVAMNMQGSWLSARRHAPVMNRLHGLWSFGTLIGGVASSRVAAAGIPVPAHAIGAAAILVALLAYVGPGLLARDESHREPHGEGNGASGPPSPVPAPSAPARNGRAGVSLVSFGLAGFFAVAIEAGSIDWAAFRLSDDFGATPGLAALAYVALTVGMTVARFAGDAAAVRIGQTPLRRASIGAAGAGLLLASVAPSELLVLAGYLTAGLGTATLLPVLYDAAAKRPGRTGAGLGALTAGLRISTLVVPATVGGIAAGLDRVGAAVAVVTLPSVAAFWVVTRRLD